MIHNEQYITKSYRQPLSDPIRPISGWHKQVWSFQGNLWTHRQSRWKSFWLSCWWSYFVWHAAKKHSTRNESVRTNLTLYFLSFQLCDPLVYFGLFIHEYLTFKTFSSGRHSRGCCDFVERPSYQTYWDTITNSSPIQFDGTELLWFGHAHYHVSWVPGSKIIKLCLSSLVYLRAKNVKFYLEVAFLEDEVDNEINQIFISYHMLCILPSHNRWKQ